MFEGFMWTLTSGTEVRSAHAVSDGTRIAPVTPQPQGLRSGEFFLDHVMGGGGAAVRGADMAQDAPPAATGSLAPLLVVLGLAVVALVAVLVVQLSDPDRHRRAEERRALIGDSWRPRKVVRHLPPDGAALEGRERDQAEGAQLPHGDGNEPDCGQDRSVPPSSGAVGPK